MDCAQGTVTPVTESSDILLQITTILQEKIILGISLPSSIFLLDFLFLGISCSIAPGFNFYDPSSVIFILLLTFDLLSIW